MSLNSLVFSGPYSGNIKRHNLGNIMQEAIHCALQLGSRCPHRKQQNATLSKEWRWEQRAEPRREDTQLQKLRPWSKWKSGHPRGTAVLRSQWIEIRFQRYHGAFVDAQHKDILQTEVIWPAHTGWQETRGTFSQREERQITCPLTPVTAPRKEHVQADRRTQVRSFQTEKGLRLKRPLPREAFPAQPHPKQDRLGTPHTLLLDFAFIAFIVCVVLWVSI